MQASPSTHFVSFAQAILYRGAGIDVVWPRFVFVGVIGAVFLAFANCASARPRRRPFDVCQNVGFAKG
jgi:ABC-type multidrug transport system permease subunit